MIRRLHDGEDVEEVKAEFREVLAGVSSLEIATIEEELIKEGMPASEVHRLCDVHLAVFRETIEREKPVAPPGHPIFILLGEHSLLLDFAEQLRDVAKAIGKAKSFKAAARKIKKLQQTAQHFKDSANHYLREENVLFPYLEKRGVTQPPKIMWMEHDKIRETEKDLYALIDTREALGFTEFTKKLSEIALTLAEMLASHFQKENSILFPTALKVIQASEWPEVRRQFDEVGYCPFTPTPPSFTAPEVHVTTPVTTDEETISFETGTLPKALIEAIFNTLPIDMTFVDPEDKVRYFSASPERIFVRTKAILGRTVQQCHPEKSVDRVVQILDDFRQGKRESAEFWINVQGRLIHIRYFPVRSKDGKYLGCLEVSQDITDIQKLKGEKRLIDQ